MNVFLGTNQKPTGELKRWYLSEPSESKSPILTAVVAITYDGNLVVEWLNHKHRFDPIVQKHICDLTQTARAYWNEFQRNIGQEKIPDGSERQM